MADTVPAAVREKVAEVKEAVAPSAEVKLPRSPHSHPRRTHSYARALRWHRVTRYREGLAQRAPRCITPSLKPTDPLTTPPPLLSVRARDASGGQGG